MPPDYTPEAVAAFAGTRARVDPRSRGRVLVVEDDAETRFAYRALLERAGWEVEESADGEELERIEGL